MWCVPCTKVLAREQWRRVLSQAARNWDRSIHVHLREVPRRLLGTWSPDLASLNLRGEHPSYQVITEAFVRCAHKPQGLDQPQRMWHQQKKCPPLSEPNLGHTAPFPLPFPPPTQETVQTHLFAEDPGPAPVS